MLVGLVFLSTFRVVGWLVILHVILDFFLDSVVLLAGYLFPPHFSGLGTGYPV
jgi:hypothetical protein